jgi:hypothetical protein
MVNIYKFWLFLYLLLTFVNNNLFSQVQVLREVKLCCDNQYFFTSYHNKSVEMWDYNTGDFVSEFIVDENIGGFDISPDGKIIVVLDKFPRLTFFKVNDGSIIKIIDLNEALKDKYYKGFVYVLKFLNNELLLLNEYLFNVTTGKLQYIHTESPKCISSDCTYGIFDKLNYKGSKPNSTTLNLINLFDGEIAMSYTIDGRIDINNVLFEDNSNNIVVFLRTDYNTKKETVNYTLFRLDFATQKLQTIKLQEIAYACSPILGQAKNNIINYVYRNCDSKELFKTPYIKYHVDFRSNILKNESDDYNFNGTYQMNDSILWKRNPAINGISFYSRYDFSHIKDIAFGNKSIMIKKEEKANTLQIQVIQNVPTISDIINIQDDVEVFYDDSISKINYLTRIEIIDELYRKNRIDIALKHADLIIVDNSINDIKTLYEIAKHFEKLMFYKHAYIMYNKIINQKNVNKEQLMLTKMRIADLCILSSEIPEDPITIYEDLCYNKSSDERLLNISINSCVKCYEAIQNEINSMSDTYFSNIERMEKIIKKENIGKKTSLVANFVGNTLSDFNLTSSFGFDPSIITGSVSDLSNIYAKVKDKEFHTLKDQNDKIDSELLKLKTKSTEIMQQIPKDVVDGKSSIKMPNLIYNRICGGIKLYLITNENCLISINNSDYYYFIKNKLGIICLDKPGKYVINAFVHNNENCTWTDTVIVNSIEQYLEVKLDCQNKNLSTNNYYKIALLNKWVGNKWIYESYFYNYNEKKEVKSHITKEFSFVIEMEEYSNTNLQTTVNIDNLDYYNLKTTGEYLFSSQQFYPNSWVKEYSRVSSTILQDLYSDDNGLIRNIKKIEYFIHEKNDKCFETIESILHFGDVPLNTKHIYYVYSKYHKRMIKYVNHYSELLLTYKINGITYNNVQKYILTTYTNYDHFSLKNNNGTIIQEIYFAKGIGIININTINADGSKTPMVLIDYKLY